MFGGCGSSTFFFDKEKNNIMNKLVENVRHKLTQKTIRANGRKWFSVTKMTIALFAWASSKIISKGWAVHFFFCKR